MWCLQGVVKSAGPLVSGVDAKVSERQLLTRQGLSKVGKGYFGSRGAPALWEAHGEAGKHLIATGESPSFSLVTDRTCKPEVSSLPDWNLQWEVFFVLRPRVNINLKEKFYDRNFTILYATILIFSSSHWRILHLVNGSQSCTFESSGSF